MNIEQLVLNYTFHSPIRLNADKPDEMNFLYSTLDVKLPVPGGTKAIQLRRKIECPLGRDQKNEEAGATRYFTNMLNFIFKSATDYEEEIYADDDEVFDLVIGKSSFKIDRDNLKEPQFIDEYVDFTKGLE
jgi:hypothetical protein